MSSAVRSKVLIAALLLIAMVVMFEVASAQYGRGGMGGYGGGYGGGRGYGSNYGGGYGRGRGGYGGGYGGGRGRGGYGGRGRGYGGGYYNYGNNYGMVSPSYYSSGYYDDNMDDDYSSYMDSYAASSSPIASANGGGAGSTQSGLAAPSGTGAGQESGMSGGGSGWQPEQFVGGGGSGLPGMQWGSFEQQQQSQLNGRFGGDSAFDLVTGADQSLGGGVGESSARATSTGPSNAVSRTNERTSLPSAASRTLPAQLAAGATTIATPIVPTSTTTAAPEYVMINPVGTSRMGDNNNDDQDE